MKNKMMHKFLSLVATMMLLLVVFSTPVFAGGIMGEVFGVPEVTPSITDADITKMTEEVLGVVKYVGVAIAIGMVLYAGIKYMMSAANDKAELKNSSIRLIIGAIIIAGAAVLFPAFWDVFSKISK